MFFNPMMMDPIYMVVMIVGAALVFLPQIWVKNTVKEFTNVASRNGKSGADVALDILRNNGLSHVDVEMTPGQLSDHYDPSAKAVRLSPDIYQGRTIAAAAIAAHEVGHAIQHAKGYKPVEWRSALVPAANLGSQMGPILLMISLGLGLMEGMMPAWAMLLAWFGVFIFAASVLFHVVTLPVEIDASMRAVKILTDGRYLVTDEIPGAKKVLTAAAMTYVSVALYSLIQLVYYIFRITALSERRS